jgi:acetoin utilization deacetylase AcuC-like enzyme
MLKIAHRNIYAHPLPEGHRFPMLKYELLPEQLLYEGTCNQANFFEPDNANDIDIAAVHTKAYIDSLKQLNLDKKAIRKIGFPLSKELVSREEIITDGSIKASDFALKFGVAMNVAGGTHHAYTNRGEAFCLFNDQAVAARYLQRHRDVNKILIVDLDVHQGNGTAEIFQNDPISFYILDAWRF